MEGGVNSVTWSQEQPLVPALSPVSRVPRVPQCVPRSLDCARAGRHFCQPGSSQCGPCLYPLVETSRGRCVVRRRPTPRPAHPSHGTVSRFPELDEEIDLLSAVISEQRTISKVPGTVWYCLDPSRPESSPAAPTERPRSHSVPVPSVNPAGTTNNTTPDLLSAPVILPYPPNNNVFIIMSSVLIIAGSVALVVAAACWVRLQRGVHLTQKMDYPVYGLMGAPTFDSLAPLPVVGHTHRSSPTHPPVVGPPHHDSPYPLKYTTPTVTGTHPRTRGQEVGPQRPDVPLPAPEAADALHGEVGAPSLCAPP
ncbi:Neural proliferation differentiation and control protein 1 [Takifugu flavidus]|uniref:Neural proliferation differentiation and control protein 1 n=1 Tax=Takifugu flavidus TaxID=433684 RepID=A0A5C6N161_9TELE|nr:Neural proliferation differentiation and control protein 1 [Takifugu flavidus]